MKNKLLKRINLFLRLALRIVGTFSYGIVAIVFIKMFFTVMSYSICEPRTIIEKSIIKEYNYLKSLLDRPSAKKTTETNGLSGFQTSEWPVMTLSLFCYGARNLAQYRPELKPEIIIYMRKAIERVMRPEYYNFIVAHYGNPFKDEQIGDNAFYLGHVIMMIASYREVADDDYFDKYFHKFAEGFYKNYIQSPTRCLGSYSDLSWTSEQAPPLRALEIHDRIFESGYSRAVDEWHESMVNSYMDHGVLVTMVSNEPGWISEGPRTIPNVWTILFLHDVLPDFCRDLYSNLKEHFLIRRLGFPMFKEFLGKKQRPTGDTGPIIWGAAPSSTAFAMGCAALYGDSEVFVPISLLVDCFGMPVSISGKSYFLLGGAIGTASIFMCRSMLLLNSHTLQKTPFYQIGATLIVILIILLIVIYRIYVGNFKKLK